MPRALTVVRPGVDGGKVDGVGRVVAHKVLAHVCRPLSRIELKQLCSRQVCRSIVYSTELFTAAAAATAVAAVRGAGITKGNRELSLSRSATRTVSSSGLTVASLWLRTKSWPRPLC